jgi:phosphatidate cytidylyltransferase
MSRGLSDLPVRLATAAAYGAVVLGTLLWGRTLGWAILIALAASLALSEFYVLTRESSRMPNEVFGVIATAAMPLAAAMDGLLGLNAAFTVLVIASLIWHLAFRQVRLADTAVTLFGAVYVGYTLAHLVLLRSLDSGALFVLATLVSVWLNDILAYFVGSTLGRRRLAPRVSPNKTWEGFAAGTLASVLVWVAVFYVTDTGIAFGWHLLIGVAVGIAAVVGDLAESRIKREIGVKDSGRLLPGHGGFLDRFDALILVSVVAYYLLVWAGAR